MVDSINLISLDYGMKIVTKLLFNNNKMKDYGMVK